MSDRIGARRVLLVDDDADVRHATGQTLALAGLDVRTHASAASALLDLDSRFEGVVISDMRMPRIDGRALFTRIQAVDSEIPVIFITGHGEIADAVEAMRNGAYDFIAKPFTSERLVATVHRALERRGLVLENRRLRVAAQEGDDLGALIGASPAIVELRAKLRGIAETDLDVLIEGEPGSGKETVARALHALSRRRKGPFVSMRCAAAASAALEAELFGDASGPRRAIGRIEAADEGVLFIDDLELLPDSAQARLTRALEDRELIVSWAAPARVLNVRIIAASAADLPTLVETGRLRRDLFYRITVARIVAPPLRERRDDVPILFAHLLDQAARRFKRNVPDIDASLRNMLMGHSWPGNVRELQRFAEQVVLGQDLPGLSQPYDDRSPEGLRARVDSYEASIIRDALQTAQGDVRHALIALQLPRKTFYEKVRRHGIDLQEFRRKTPSDR